MAGIGALFLVIGLPSKAKLKKVSKGQGRVKPTLDDFNAAFATMFSGLGRLLKLGCIQMG
jgi:hypothetical protein